MLGHDLDSQTPPRSIEPEHLSISGSNAPSPSSTPTYVTSGSTGSNQPSNPNKRPRPTSPSPSHSPHSHSHPHHPFLPGSPTGSSPKRAMSEEHFFERDRQGQKQGQALLPTASIGASALSGLGDESILVKDEDDEMGGGPSIQSLHAQQDGNVIVPQPGSSSSGAKPLNIHPLVSQTSDQPPVHPQRPLPTDPKPAADISIDPSLFLQDEDYPGSPAPKGMSDDVLGSGASGSEQVVDDARSVGPSREAEREERPSNEDVIKLIRASSEAELHPDDIIYLLPSSFILSLLSSPSSSKPGLDLVPFIDSESHDSPTGKFTSTRAVKGTAAWGGFRLKNGLGIFDWDSGAKGAGKAGGGEGEEQGEGGEMVFVKEDCWRKVVSWFGPPNPPMGIRRTVKSDPQTGFLSVELNPPNLILHKAVHSASSKASAPSRTGHVGTAPIRIVVPAAVQISDLHLAAFEALLLDGEVGESHSRVTMQDVSPSRLWRLEVDPAAISDVPAEVSSAGIDEDYDAPMVDGKQTTRIASTLLIPSHLLPVCSARLIHSHPAPAGRPDLDLSEALIENGDVFVLESQVMSVDGELSWMVDVNEAGLAQELPGGEPVVDAFSAEAPVQPRGMELGEEPKLAPLFSTGLAYTGSHPPRQSPPAYQAESSKMGAAATAGLTTRSQADGRKAKTAVRGLRGLSNLGNTCFMNSALQCLSNTEELNRYILSGLHKQELNRSNPLGMGGKVADAFGNLIENLWDPVPPKQSGGYFGGYSNAVQPRDLKNIVGRFAPQFQGYGQQDTQELLAFLLDGLHEDLNRIDKKPYVEKPDWKDGGGDEELALFGKENWDGYRKRNDSVIVDLFQGQLKSTLTCPVCTKASITLDPFMYLTVPLPVKNTKDRMVYFVPFNGDQRMKLTVQHTAHTTFGDLKKKIGDLVGVPANTLLATDEFSHYIYAYWKDDQAVIDARTDDVLVFHQMPGPVQQTLKIQGPVDPAAMISVPVYTWNSGGRAQCFPFFVHLTLSEAKSPSAIKKAIANGYRALVDHDMEDALFGRAATLNDNDGTGDVARNVTDLHLDDKQTPEAATNSSDASVTASSPKASVYSLASSSSEPPRSDLYEVKFVSSSDSEGKSSFGSNKRGYFTGSSGGGYSVQEWVTKKKGMLGRVFNALHRSSEEESESKVQLLDHGDLIAVQWNEKAIVEYLGRDREGRYRDGSEYVITEDPAVQIERKKAEVARKRGITLDDCLEEFSKKETLGENDLWYCPHCKEHRAATKRLEIYQVPDILVIALKRFGARGAGKINVSVDFPINGLDLTSRTLSRQVGEALLEAGKDPEAYGIPAMDEPLVYDLYAVDNHFGGMGGGHYTAHARNQDNGKWYNFDDSSVSEIDQGALDGSSAYLLFYNRRSKRPRGAGTAHKIAEAESVASSMILDPALNPYKAHRETDVQDEDSYSPPISTSGSSDSSDDNRTRRSEEVMAWERGASRGYGSPDNDNFVSIDASPQTPPESPAVHEITPLSEEDSDGIVKERLRS